MYCEYRVRSNAKQNPEGFNSFVGTPVAVSRHNFDGYRGHEVNVRSHNFSVRTTTTTAKIT